MYFIQQQKDNGIILKNAIIKNLGDYVTLFKNSIIFNNAHISQSNTYVTGDIAFLVKFLGE